MASSQGTKSDFDEILERRMASREEFVLVVTYRATTEQEAADQADMLADRLHGLGAVQGAQWGPENSVITVAENLKNLDIP